MAVDRIPDDALAVRGGRNRPEDFERGVGTHPSGITGVSVESAVDKSISDLTSYIPHSQIGVTTVGAIRAAGGDVVRTNGRSPHHATIVGLDAATASRLFTPTIVNPAKTDHADS